MPSLKPMTPAEFENYLAASIPGFAGDKVRAGAWPAEGAIERSRKAFDHFLPEGMASPGHSFHVVVDEDGATAVGVLWIFVDPKAPANAFLYHIVIDEPHRGRGLGSAALDLAEGYARGHGCTSMELNVFGWNTRALELYNRHGYSPVDIRMRKDLAPS